MTDINNTTPDTTTERVAMRDALERTRDILEKIPAADVVETRGLDATAAIAIAMGSLPRIEKHRDAVAAELGEPRASILDGLREVVLGTAQADFEVMERDPESDLSEASDELGDAHGLLLADADALSRRGLIDPAIVEQCRPVAGYVTLVGSTVRLAKVLRDHWPTISGRTPTTLEDIERAERLAQAFMSRLSQREQGTSRMPALELRARAMTHLIRTYGEVRRMIAFVRHWDGDAESIAPSLWSGRRGKGRGDGGGPVVTDPLPVPVITGPNNGGGPFAT